MRFVVKCIDNYEQIECYKGNECIGYINYKFDSRSVWLNKIKVDKAYRGCGVGTTLLKIFENEATKLRKVVVTGKFYPEDEDGLTVKKFYESNGYSIEKEGYETELYKVLKTKHDLSGVDINYEYSNMR